MNYFKVLGVADTATDAEIKKAYRELAKKYHPDTCKDADADAKFREINEAYEKISTQEKRDNLASNVKFSSYGDHFSGAPFTNWANTFNSDLFGGRNKRQGPRIQKTYAAHLDVTITESIPLQDLYDKKITTFKYKYLKTRSGSTTYHDSSFDVDYSVILQNIRRDSNGEYVTELLIQHQTSSEVIETDIGYNQFINEFYGFLRLKIKIDCDSNLKLNGLDITQEVEVSLNSILFDEKIQVETFAGTKYNLTIKKYTYLDNIQVRIPKMGFNLGTLLGDYVFSFKILPPNFTNLKDLQLKKLKELLLKV